MGLAKNFGLGLEAVLVSDVSDHRETTVSEGNAEREGNAILICISGIVLSSGKVKVQQLF